MKQWFLIAIAGLILLSSAVYADTAQMKTTLVKIVNQLEAIKPLIEQAKQEQPANSRIKVHFDSWIGADGQVHNGLRQDIDTIQQALIHAINQTQVDPRVYQPIKGDFVGQDHV